MFCLVAERIAEFIGLLANFRTYVEFFNKYVFSLFILTLMDLFGCVDLY